MLIKIYSSAAIVFTLHPDLGHKMDYRKWKWLTGDGLIVIYFQQRQRQQQQHSLCETRHGVRQHENIYKKTKARRMHITEEYGLRHMLGMTSCSWSGSGTTT